MVNLDQLLLDYSRLDLQRADDITDRVKRLRQQTGAEIATIREFERHYIAAQEEVLEKIRPILAADARSILAADEFRIFAQVLLQTLSQTIAQTELPLSISPNSQKWNLAKLPVPLQLQAIEVVEASSVDEGNFQDRSLKIEATLKTWQQTILIPGKSPQQ